jgi:pimeloyl-ACP methyl ester carboxylesterase
VIGVYFVPVQFKLTRQPKIQRLFFFSQKLTIGMFHFVAFIALLSIRWSISFYVPIPLRRMGQFSCNAVNTFRPIAPPLVSKLSFELLNQEANVPQNIVLFLPGLDGVGSYSLPTLSTLTDSYECWRLVIDSQDRSSFLALAKVVLDKVKSFPRPITLIGESFGGVLASYIAARAPDQIATLVLVNPATSIANTPWRSIAPLIASTGPLYPVAGLSTLFASSVQPQQVFSITQRIFQQIQNTSTINMAWKKIVEEFEPFIQLPSALPADTLSWRLQEWLDTGNYLVKDLFSSITSPTLLLIGLQDRLLPSAKEGPRLKKLLIHSKYVELNTFPGKGHALLDQSFSTQLSSILHEFALTLYRKDTGDLSATMPSVQDILQAEKQFAPFINAVSPIFLSMTSEGEIVEGIASVPIGTAGRPVLLVGNHQLLGMKSNFFL